MHKSLFLYSQEKQAAQQQLEELQARPNVKVTAWACHLASPGDNLWAQESTARLHQESPELATCFFLKVEETHAKILVWGNVGFLFRHVVPMMSILQLWGDVSEPTSVASLLKRMKDELPENPLGGIA